MVATGTTPATAGLPIGPLTAEEVCSYPDAQVRYPGSTPLRDLQAGTKNLNDAFCGVVFASADDQEKIFDYYTKYLLDHGYSYYSGGLGGAMVAARMFERPPSCREYVVMGTDAPTVLASSGVAVSVPAGTRTVFEYAYSVDPDDNRDCSDKKPIPPVPTTLKPLV